MEDTRNRGKRLRSRPPLRPEQLLHLDNILNHGAPPKALFELTSSNSFTFLDAPEHFAAESAIRRLSSVEGSAWQIDPRRKVVRGLPLRGVTRLDRPDLRLQSPTLPLPPPSRPDWADVIYHPKMAARRPAPVMRRRDGSRLRPHFVWGGNDVRQPFYPAGYPLHCIGRIFVYLDPASPNWSWSGTGALVGPDVVLTATHLVPWPAEGAMMLFIPAYYNGFSTLGPYVYSYVTAAASYEETTSPDPAWDFAVLQLADRLGDSLGWFGTKTYDAGWNDRNYWTLVGYAGAVDNAAQPSIQYGISFHDNDSSGDATELETEDGDASPGDSGGPYFALWNDGPYIVGVDSAEEVEYVFPFSSEPNNVASAGAALPTLVQWARDHWS